MKKEKINRKMKASAIAILFLLSATMISSASLTITDTGITIEGLNLSVVNNSLNWNGSDISGIATRDGNNIIFGTNDKVGIGKNPNVKLQVNGSLCVDNLTGTPIFMVNELTGYVGIGTTTPESKLHLVDTGSLQLILHADTDNANESDVPSILFRRDGSTNALQIGIVGQDEEIFTGSVGNMPYIYSPSSNKNIQFATDNGLAMEITSGRDVNIMDVLSVSNEIRVATNGSASDPGYTWEDDVDTGIFRAGTNALGFTTAGSEAMRIDASGKVGIWTSNPSAVLDVANTDPDIAPELGLKRIDTSIEDTNALGAVYFTGTDGGSEAAPQIGAGIIAWAAEPWATGDFGTDLDFYTADIGSSTLTSRMRIDSTGNIGIGTSTIPLDGFPTDFDSSGILLEIGDGTVDSGITIRSRTSSSNAFDIWQDYSLIDLYIDARRDDDDSNIYFRTKTAGTPISALTIMGSGKVGIGDSTPSYQLELSTDSAGKPTTNTWTISSDERIKKNIKDFTDGLDIVMNINPRTYEYNGAGGLGYEDDGEEHIGVIAQELEPITPYMISSFNGTLNGEKTELFNYQGHALPFILVNAVQELKAENDALEQRITQLEILIQELLNG